MQARLSIRVCVALSSLMIASLSRSAEAHFNLNMPPPADATNDGGKGAPPCGPTTTSGVVTQVMGGHPLMISINETVYHPGHYRIALATSRAGLPADPPVVVQNGASVSAPIQNPAVFPVLADGVYVHTAPVTQPFAPITVTLPNNITCTTASPCTLQVIQFMAQHGLNTFPDGGVAGGYYYHHCASLAITPDPTLSGVGDAGSGTDVRAGTGGMNGTAGASGGGTGGRGVGGGNGTAGAAGGIGGTSGGVGGAVGSAGQSGGTGVGGKGVGGSGDAGTIDVVTPPDAGCGSCAVSTRGGAAGWTAAGLLIAGLLLRRRRRS